MKNFPTKINISAGDDTGSTTTFGANEFNSLATENETAVTSTGQTLATGETPDTTTDQLARALVMVGQAASSYSESGAVNAYVLTSTLATLVQPTAYFDGMRVKFIPGSSNTATSTINVSGLGVKAIRTVANVAITSGALLSTKMYELVYISSYASGSGAFVVNNDIEDHDSGTFTPVLELHGGSATPQDLEGSYSKSGKTVTVIIGVQLTAVSVSEFGFSNLPFAMANNNWGVYGAAVAEFLGGTWTAGNKVIYRILPGTTEVDLRKLTPTTHSEGFFGDDLTAGSRVFLNMTYITD